MKRICWLLLLAVSGVSLMSYAADEKKVDDLIGLIAQQIAEKQTAPLQAEIEQLQKQVAASKNQLELCQKGLEEVGSTQAEDPKTRYLKLGGCFAGGAGVAAILLLLL